MNEKNTNSLKEMSEEESRQIQMNILVEISHICKRNNIKYSLAYGSLLGAVRHKGFIPWDDDIDIVIIRDDYEKLLDAVKNNHDCEWLKIIDGSNSDNYYYPFAKAVDDRTIAIQDDNKTEQSIWVDIFPLDYVPEDKRECDSFLKKNLLLRNLIIAMTTNFSNPFHVEKFVVKFIMNLFAIVVGKKRIYTYTEKLNKKYYVNKSNYVACLSSAYIKKERMQKKLMEDVEEIPFENKFFLATKEWDFYLRNFYGDYMQLPPLKKRKTHHIKAFWK